MDVLYVYCFKSVSSYKHKLSRIESLVILYWGINCIKTNYRLMHVKSIAECSKWEHSAILLDLHKATSGFKTFVFV